LLVSSQPVLSSRLREAIRDNLHYEMRDRLFGYSFKEAWFDPHGFAHPIIGSMSGSATPISLNPAMMNSRPTHFSNLEFVGSGRVFQPIWNPDHPYFRPNLHGPGCFRLSSSTPSTASGHHRIPTEACSCSPAAERGLSGSWLRGCRRRFGFRRGRSRGLRFQRCDIPRCRRVW
jgi:hypothetical protein